MFLSGKKGLRTVILVMTLTVIAGLMVAGIYYRNLNQSVDPRIREARELYEDYNRVALEGDYHAIFRLLDSVEQVYFSTSHYRNSFETGVLHNNRAAAILTIALHRESIPAGSDPFPEAGFDSLVTMAEDHILKALEIYNHFQELYTGRSAREIRTMIAQGFIRGMEELSPKARSQYLDRRVKEVMDATVENTRRLSVCYSNLGLVYRHRGEARKAAENYHQALRLWDRNLDAENNMNLLLGRPVRQRNLLQRLFPPEKTIK